MERLSIDEIIADFEYDAKQNRIDLDISYAEENEQVAKWLKELKAYRDAEEQGLLLRLPCKVGTKVWCIMCGMTGKHPMLFTQDFEVEMIKHWGVAVFLTKEAAEQKLAEMKGGAE